MTGSIVMAMVIWLAPQWLAGAAAVLAPLLIHLWTRQTGPPRYFPTIRLLVQTNADLPILQRWRDPLLLLLRCALIILIAMAFAQPRWQPPGASASPADTETSATRPLAIVLDASASMRRTWQGLSMFDRARKQTGQLIARARSQNQPVNVYLAQRNAQALLPRFTDDHDAMIRALDAAEPGWGFADLAAALAAVPGNADPIIITDAQRSSVPDTLIRRILQRRGRLVNINPDHQAANLSVSRPRLTYQPGAIGLVLSATVTNHGPTPRQTIARLHVNQNAGPMRQISLEPGQSALIEYSIEPPTQRVRPVQLAIEDPHFDPDNTLWWFAEPARRPAVRLISADDPNDPSRAAFFLARALSPDDQLGFALQIGWPAAIDQDPADVWVIDGSEALTDDQLRAVGDPNAGPTGVVWLGGSVRLVQRLNDLGLGRLIPIDNAEPVSGPRLQTLDQIDLTQPFWHRFTPGALDALMRRRFQPALAGSATPDAQILAHWSSGDPALAIHQSGQLRLAWFNIAEDVASGDATGRARLIPLLHELVHRVRSINRPAGDATVGQPLHVRFNRPGDLDSAKLELTGPTGRLVPFILQGLQSDQRLLTEPLSRPGAYRLTDGTGALVDGWFVGLDPRERDLTPARLADNWPVADAAGAPTVRTTGQPNQPSAWPLWPWLIMLAAGVGLGEWMLSQWYDRPVEPERP